MIAAVIPFIEGRGDNERVFSYTSFANFVRKDRNEILLPRINSHFEVGDLRKFTEQTDLLSVGSSQIVHTNLKAQSIRSKWKYYRHPLPEYVYDVYIEYGGI